MTDRKAYVSECGQYVAVPFGDDCAAYDVIETATGRVWLARRYRSTGFGDTDRRYTHAEFPRMVTRWSNEGQRRGKRWISAFDLSFVDADVTIPIKAFTGNVVVTSYSAAFRRAVPRSHTRRLAEWRAIIAKAEAEYRGGVGVPATVGARIQAARENLGMSREDLGEIVGLSKAHVGAIERDARRLTAGRAAQFERALSLGDGELTL